MNQLKLDETLTIVSNEETKNSVNAVVSKMPSKGKDRLKRENNSSKKVVVTPYYLQLFSGDVEDWSLMRPISSEGILLRVLMWLDGVDFFRSRKEALDWLTGYEFNNNQVGWISPHIVEFVVP